MKTPNKPKDVARGSLRGRVRRLSAAKLAGDWWWDEEYYAATEQGRVLWECVRMTGGDSIRLSRLDNKQLRGFVRYVKPETKMRLVAKTPNEKLSDCGEQI